MSELLARARRLLQLKADIGHLCAMEALRQAFAEIDRLRNAPAFTADWSEVDAAIDAMDEGQRGRLILIVGGMRQEINRLASMVYVPGLWRCAKCGFQLMQANLNAADGTVTARDTPGNKCPNCNGPLWRVTERQAGNDLVDRMGPMQEEITALRARLNAGDREQLAPGREHLTVSGTFQSDKYAWCPAGFVPLKLTDPMARDLLLEYAKRRAAIDRAFFTDLVDAIERTPGGGANPLAPPPTPA